MLQDAGAPDDYYVAIGAIFASTSILYYNLIFLQICPGMRPVAAFPCHRLRSLDVTPGINLVPDHDVSSET
jgi:hypothetical protein